jgi:hypothetical protein
LTEDTTMRSSLFLTGLAFLLAVPSILPAAADAPAVSSTLSLDGTWLLATDPQNVGRTQGWFNQPTADAKAAKVPWIIQATFPAYHGVAWYWRDFDAPANPHVGGRYLLRFGQVDYLAEVWINGVSVGGHEGGEAPFTLDVTKAIKPGQKNRVAVRVLNPTHTPIDGIVLKQTGKRCKTIPFSSGGSFNHGGITESVELLCISPVYVDDLYVIPRVGEKTNNLHVQTTVRNTAAEAKKGTIDITVAPALTGKTTAAVRLTREFPAGDSTVATDLSIDNPRLWQLGDPYLYRVTVRVQIDGNASIDEQSTRCGFRDFRFTDGYFRLNGKRIYLRCSHTVNNFPIGQQFPQDPDLLRRDLLNLKVMGFNSVRFIWGGATPVQLDLCDEIGLMVYDETYMSGFGDWTMELDSSPKMAERFNSGVTEIMRRDRNHPSVVMWGLLNEASNTPGFHLAVKSLPLVRTFDNTRVVMLNSGRFDGVGSGIGSVSGIVTWPPRTSTEPWVGINTAASTVEALGITWPAGHLALHPGPKNENSVVRWTAPVGGEAEVAVKYVGLAKPTTTDVHLLHKGRSLFDGLLNIGGSANEAGATKKLVVAAGDTIDAVVGWGNGSHGADTTGLTFVVKLAGKTYDATRDFSADRNPSGAWTYGQVAPTGSVAAAQFVAYPAEGSSATIGSISNPGSGVWEDIVSDRHIYPRVPHTADTIDMLRKLNATGQNVFFSEYGIGSAVDLWRAVRHFEQRGAADLEDSQYFRGLLGRFSNDWKNWRLDEAFGRPEDFFMESLKKMAGQRTLGLNAIRANPNIVSHSLTGAIDHVMCGEGLTTLFRELKPGTIDALFDAWAPLRWCLFAEPVHIRRGAKMHLEAVLANEDVLTPGEYPARLQVIGPNLTRVMDREIKVRILPSDRKHERPFAQLCFSDDVVIDGPTGKYRFTATFQQGAAAAGGETEFYVTDPAEMPKVDAEVVLWGDDPQLAQWLKAKHVRTRPFAAGTPAAREVILASAKPAAPGKAAAFAELARHVARGSTVVFLSPQVFAEKDRPTRWLPLANKGTLVPISGWLYLKDEWAKRHPMFEGLQSGGLMDYNYYREIIPDLVWQGQNPPEEAVAGAIKASQDYCSGLMVSVYRLGEGRVILNTLQIRENLGSHPAAERLLRNMLRYASCDLAKPIKPLPADFDRQLRSMDY